MTNSLARSQPVLNCRQGGEWRTGLCGRAQSTNAGQQRWLVGGWKRTEGVSLSEDARQDATAKAAEAWGWLPWGH